MKMNTEIDLDTKRKELIEITAFLDEYVFFKRN